MSCGCADWPRFANLPPPEAVPAEAPDELVLGEAIVEPACDGWPDAPAQLPAVTQGSLGAWWEVTRLEGALAPFGESGLSKAPFADCAGVEPTVQYTADSDLDWVHLQSDGRPLCLLLEADEALAPEWDAVVHVFDPDEACVSGTFLNPSGGGQPLLTVPNVGTFVADVPEGPIAIYVAGVTAGPGAAGAEVPYTLHVVPATVPESCAALGPADVNP